AAVDESVRERAESVWAPSQRYSHGGWLGHAAWLGAVERAGEKVPERGPLLGVEGPQHLVLDLFLGALGETQRLCARGGEPDQVAAPVARVAQARDMTQLLE